MAGAYPIHDPIIFTHHSEFCHQSFDAFVAHISVFIGGTANILQPFFLLELVDEILSFFILLCFLSRQFKIFNNKHFFISKNTRKLTLEALFYKISSRSYWVSYIKRLNLNRLIWKFELVQLIKTLIQQIRSQRTYHQVL